VAALGPDSSLVSFIKENCVAVAVDGYVPGNSAERAFYKKVVKGVNQAMLVTADGQHLGGFSWNSFNTLPEGVEKFRKLPEAQRKPKVERPQKVTHESCAPTPPAGGLVAICYCSYLEREAKGQLARAKTAYGDAYAGSAIPISPAYTDIEMFWLTKDEAQALLPADARVGMTFPVPAAIQKRIFHYYAFDFRACDRLPQPLRAGEMTLTVEEASADRLRLRLAGFSKTGVEYAKYESDPPKKTGDGSGFVGESAKAGCELTFHGLVEYDRKKQAFTHFDLLGVGDAWGEGTNRYRGAGKNGKPNRWPIGLAFELVTSNRPVDRIPPLRANAYAGGEQYFGTGK
jgi:hypothetical protein